MHELLNRLPIQTPDSILDASRLHPDIIPLMKASSMIVSEDIDTFCRIQEILPRPADIQKVLTLMTPGHIREQQAHERTILSSSEFPSFTSLLAQGERIRNLELVPQRNAETQAQYERVDRAAFLTLVEEYYLDGHNASWVKELYPSDLPDDVSQYVVWFNEQRADDRMAADFIAKVVRLMGLDSNEIILFERSRTSATDFVKVAIPEYRHIHVWTRKP